MTERMLASVQRIDAVFSVSNADSLDVVCINGWEVVVRRNEFTCGDLVIYLEIDSWVPHEIAPFLSRGKAPAEHEGLQGQRLRTVKLRGQISQGLVLPLSIAQARDSDKVFQEGDDVSALLGVIKYEPTVAAQLRGRTRGSFPSFIQKTDQERIQNCWERITNQTDDNSLWVVQEKLDGSSCTMYTHEGRVGVCSRNLDLDLEQEGNTFVSTAKQLGYVQALASFDRSIAVQAELCGPGIQQNKYKLAQPHLYVFDVWLIKEGRYATVNERDDILEALTKLGAQIETVPHIDVTCLPETMKECLAKAEGKSMLCPTAEREGLVWKTYELECDGSRVISFKAISNKFLLQEKD